MTCRVLWFNLYNFMLLNVSINSTTYKQKVISVLINLNVY